MQNPRDGSLGQALAYTRLEMPAMNKKSRLFQTIENYGRKKTTKWGLRKQKLTILNYGHKKASNCKLRSSKDEEL
jgi:hypothetical protein